MAAACAGSAGEACMASLMVWIPMRSDSAMNVLEDQSGSSPTPAKTKEAARLCLDRQPSRIPGSPVPHRPRRGPHGSPSAPSPSRVRTPARRVVARSLCAALTAVVQRSTKRDGVAVHRFAVSSAVALALLACCLGLCAALASADCMFFRGAAAA